MPALSSKQKTQNKYDIHQQTSTTKNKAVLSLFVGAQPYPYMTWERGVTEQHMNKM